MEIDPSEAARFVAPYASDHEDEDQLSLDYSPRPHPKGKTTPPPWAPRRVLCKSLPGNIERFYA